MVMELSVESAIDAGDNVCWVEYSNNRAFIRIRDCEQNLLRSHQLFDSIIRE